MLTPDTYTSYSVFAALQRLLFQSMVSKKP
jgi:hypothetical protein